MGGSGRDEPSTSIPPQRYKIIFKQQKNNIKMINK
jgi:hypothetical protein